MATIAVSASVDSALRMAFSQASVRVKPETLMSSVIAALEGLGLTVKVEDGVLCMTQGATEMNPILALRNFSKKPEFQQFFVQEGQHPSQWSKEKKIAFLRDHTDEEYRALLQSPVLESGLRVLDPNMPASQYKLLTRQEKMQFISAFGESAVRKIFERGK